MAVEVTIVCDGCSTVGGGGRTAGDVRAQLREAGWHNRSAVDRCPECRPDGAPMCPGCGTRHLPPLHYDVTF